MESSEAQKIREHVNEQLKGACDVNQHNLGVLQGAFFRTDVVNEALLLVLKDVTVSLGLLAKEKGIELPLQCREDGSLDQDKYFDQGHATVTQQMKQQEEAKACGTAPMQEPIIARPGEDTVKVFGGDYEDSRNTDTEECQAAP